VPTDPAKGYFLIPCDIRRSDKFRSLNAEQRGIMLSIFSACYSNGARGCTVGNLDVPPYSWVVTFEDLIEECGTTDSPLRVGLAKLEGFEWMEVRHVGNTAELTMITLLQPDRWQSFETYNSARAKHWERVRAASKKRPLTRAEKDKLRKRR